MAILGWTEFPDRELSRAADEARKAIALAPDEPDGYRALAVFFSTGLNTIRRRTLSNARSRSTPAMPPPWPPWGTVQSIPGDVAGGGRVAPARVNSIPCSIRAMVRVWRSAFYLARRHEDVSACPQRRRSRAIRTFL